MANDFTANPWFIDTVMVAPYFNAVRVGAIIWNGAINIGDSLIIKDRNGKTIVNSKCNQPNYSENFGGFGWVEGFQVTTLSSGNVSIVISKP